MSNSNETPLANSILETARRLSIGRTHLYSLLSTGEIKTIRLGGRRLIPESELQRFIAERIEAADRAAA